MKPLSRSEDVFEAAARDQISTQDAAKLLHYDEMEKALNRQRWWNLALLCLLAASLLVRP